MTMETQSPETTRADSKQREMVSIIIPIDSAVGGLPDLLADVSEVLGTAGWQHEFVLVDDGTASRTELEALRDQHDNVRLIRFHQGFGEAVALSAGFEKATGGYLITMPQYRQVKVAEILPMLEQLEQGFDFVAGWRTERVDPVLNRLQSFFFNFMARLFTRSRFHDLNCKVRAMRRKVTEEIEIYGDLFRFLPILAERQGFKITEVKLRHREELGKVGFFGVGAYLRRILDLITMFFLIKFTKKPLRFFGLVGFGLILVGVAICLYLTYEKLFADQGLSGRPLLVLGVMMIVLGMQTISIGLIGEMIIFTHAKGMKEYQVDEFLE